MYIFAFLLAVCFLSLPAFLISLSQRRNGWQKARWVLPALALPFGSVIAVQFMGYDYFHKHEDPSRLPVLNVIAYSLAWCIYLASLFRPAPSLTTRKIIYLLLAAPGAFLWGLFTLMILIGELPADFNNNAALTSLSILGLASLAITICIAFSSHLASAVGKRLAIGNIGVGIISLSAAIIIGGGATSFLFALATLAIIVFKLAVLAELV